MVHHAPFRICSLVFAGMVPLAPILAQDEVIALPDTFLLLKPEELRHVDDTTGLGRAVDHWPQWGAILIETASPWYGSDYVLALKDAGRYALVDITSGSQVQQLEIALVDVNSSGAPEMVVRWETYRGHTGWEHAIHEREWTVAIWDLDAMVRLFEFQYITAMEEWWTVFAEAPSDTLGYEEREVLESGGERHYERYDVQVERGRITIIGPYQEEGEELPGAAVEEYKPFAGGWLRVKP